MARLEMKIPPLYLLAVLIILEVWLGKIWEKPVLPDTFHQWLGLSLFVFASFILITSTVQFIRANTSVVPHASAATTQLVQSGLYRYSRNPMYVAFVALLAAISLYFSILAGAILVPGLALFLDRFQIQPEERRLLELFGSDFERYRLTTRRWL